MPALIDTSAWIEYFRSGDNSDKVDYLIDNNLVVINDLIMAELSPILKLRQEKKLLSLLGSIKKIQMHIIWNEIIELQFRCLKKGINGIGIPDLMIVQNAKQNNCNIYSLDKHFNAIRKVVGIDVMQ